MTHPHAPSGNLQPSPPLNSDPACMAFRSLSSPSFLGFVRYRSAISFMFALLALDYLGRQLVLDFYPLVRSGNPLGPYVNLFLFALTIIGLALSLWGKRDYQGQN